MIPTIVINLKYNEDRKRAMNEKLKKTCLTNIIFVDAIDGNTELNHFDFSVMPNWIDPIANKKINVGYIGCTLSHYFTWKYIVENNITKAIVLEDDTMFCDNFDDEISIILQSNIPYDLLYLNRIPLNTLYNLGPEIDVDERMVVAKYSYNASSYIITYEGAQKMINSGCIHNIVPIDELLPMMYDTHYPFKQYSQYYSTEKLLALAMKENIADQELRSQFPSSIQESVEYQI